MLEPLRSGDMDKRAGALVAITAMFGDGDASTQASDRATALKLLRGGLLPVLAPRLCDPQPIVSMHAAEVLNSLSSCGGKAVCEALVQEGDVVQAVLSTVRRYAAADVLGHNGAGAAAAGAGAGDGGKRGSGAKENQDRIAKHRALVQLFAALTHLCGESESAVGRFATLCAATPDTFHAVLRCATQARVLSAGVDPPGAADAAAGAGGAEEHALQDEASRFLQLISDANVTLADMIVGTEGAIETLGAVVGATAFDLCVRLQAAGVLCNVWSTVTAGDGGAGAAAGAADPLTLGIATVVVPLLVEALDGDAVAAFSDVASAVASAVAAQREATEVAARTPAPASESVEATVAADAAAEAAAVALGDVAVEVDEAAAADASGSVGAADDRARATAANAAAAQAQWQRGVAAQRLALEVLANVCASQDPDYDPEDEEEWEDDEAAAAAAAAAAEGADVDPRVAHVHGAVASSGVLANVAAILTSGTGAIASPEALAAAQADAAKAAGAGAGAGATAAAAAAGAPAVRVPPAARRSILVLCERAMACVCNATQTMPPEVLGGGVWALAHEACGAVGSTAVARSAAGGDARLTPEEDALVAAALGAMLSLNEAPTPAQTESVARMSAVDSGCSASVRERAVAVLGAIGRRPHDAATNGVLGAALGAAIQDPALAVTTEALNALFDVYSDEDHDATFASLGLLKACESALPDLTARIRAGGGRGGGADRDRELLNRAKEVKYNLKRFVGYKKAHLPV